MEESEFPFSPSVTVTLPLADEGCLLLPLFPERVACGLWCDHSGPTAPPRQPSGVDFPPSALPALSADLWANPSGRD